MKQYHLLSIIVPVYNTEAYLRKCVDSILSQTFQDFELILVDDGSTDRSPQICDELGSGNDIVTVVHHAKNQGLLMARYSGALVAKGRFLTFVDSDDFLDNDYYECFSNIAIQYPNIDVICGGCVVDYISVSKTLIPLVNEGLYVGKSKQDLNKIFFSYNNTMKKKILPSLWSKWLRYDFVMPFLERADKRITYAEDLSISYFAIIVAKSIYVLTDAVGYHYVQHPQQMTRNFPADYYLRIQFLADYIDKTIFELNLQEYQAQFDRSKLRMYQQGFDRMIYQKDKLELVSEAACSKSFRDIFKTVSIRKLQGLSIGSKFRLWLIYKNKVTFVHNYIVFFDWFFRTFKK